MLLKSSSLLLQAVNHWQLPPDWSFGYQQSKLRYYNQTQIEDLAQRFHGEQVKVSLIAIGSYTSIAPGSRLFTGL